MKIVLFVCQKLTEEIKKSSDLDLDRQEANKRGVKSRHRCGDIVIALRKREKDTWFIVEILNCDPFALLRDAQPDTSNRGPGT